jgi:DNA-binding NarL/FixJ family response regulator
MTAETGTLLRHAGFVTWALTGLPCSSCSRRNRSCYVKPATGWARVLRDLRQRVPCDFPSAEMPEVLSGRELEILRLMARGCSNREIADALTITEGTVKNYVSGIPSKNGRA